jgi:hypothetical protein
MNKTEQKRTTSPTPLPHRQLRAIGAILRAATLDSAAREAGVGRTTLYTWLNEPAFRLELRRQQAAVYEHGLIQLKALWGEATDELRALLASDNERIRLGALNLFFSAAPAAHECQEIEERLRMLEEHAKLSGK